MTITFVYPLLDFVVHLTVYVSRPVVGLGLNQIFDSVNAGPVFNRRDMSCVTVTFWMTSRLNMDVCTDISFDTFMNADKATYRLML